jgi:2-oxoglutarate ferredoxin oxidoreductase subunit beta
MQDDLVTAAENTWCAGCGNFGIMNAFKKAVRTLEERGTGRERVFITACIGCHAKIFDYLALSGVYSLHGRSMSVAQGIKVANPDLRVVAFTGDGAGFGEGVAHLLFAAKRNTDITVIVHNNGVYALTAGQRSPTSALGFRGPSTPRGNDEEPFNPLALMLEAGATFVARGYSARLEELAGIFVAAIEHEGFSFVEVLQPSVTFHDTYEEYNASVAAVEEPARTREEALVLARQTERLPSGILYRDERPTHESRVLNGRNPVRDHPARSERLARVRQTLEQL